MSLYENLQHVDFFFIFFLWLKKIENWITSLETKHYQMNENWNLENQIIIYIKKYWNWVNFLQHYFF
jgi:hypothetical protein